MTTEILRENWQKYRILPFWINSGSIPDRPQNCKSMGKSKGPAIPKLTKNRILPFWINSGSFPDRPQNCKSMGKSKGPAIPKLTKKIFLPFWINSGSFPDRPHNCKSMGKSKGPAIPKLTTTTTKNCHSGSIPDQFRIDLRIAKVWEKQRPSNPKIDQKNIFAILDQFRIISGSTSELQKCGEKQRPSNPKIDNKKICHSGSIPDHFRIDFRIAKVWGKAKAQQSQNWQQENLPFWINSGSIPDRLQNCKSMGKSKGPAIPKLTNKNIFAILDQFRIDLRIAKVWGKAKAQQSQNWQTKYFCHSGSIPDQFRIDPQNCKSMGKSKGPAILQKTETEHKPTQTWNCMEFPLPKKSWIQFRIKSGSTSNLQKYWEKNHFFVHTCCIYHQIPKNMKFKKFIQNITLIWFEYVCKFNFLSINLCARRLLKMKLIGLVAGDRRKGWFGGEIWRWGYSRRNHFGRTLVWR